MASILVITLNSHRFRDCLIKSSSVFLDPGSNFFTEVTCELDFSTTISSSCRISVCTGIIIAYNVGIACNFPGLGYTGCIRCNAICALCPACFKRADKVLRPTLVTFNGSTLCRVVCRVIYHENVFVITCQKIFIKCHNKIISVFCFRLNDAFLVCFLSIFQDGNNRLHIRIALPGRCNNNLFQILVNSYVLAISSFIGLSVNICYRCFQLGTLYMDCHGVLGTDCVFYSQSTVNKEVYGRILESSYSVDDIVNARCVHIEAALVYYIISKYIHVVVEVDVLQAEFFTLYRNKIRSGDMIPDFFRNLTFVFRVKILS